MDKEQPPSLSRRSFVGTGIALTSGLVVGCRIFSRRGGDSLVLDVATKDRLNAFLHVDSLSGQIYLYLDKTEMGQGVMSGYAAIVAEELNLKPEDIEVRFAPAEGVFVNHKILIPVAGLEVPVPVQITGLSSSIADGWAKLRDAAATVRELFRLAGSRASGYPLVQCRFLGQRVTCYDPKNGTIQQTYFLGQLVDTALSLRGQHLDITLKNSTAFNVLGLDPADDTVPFEQRPKFERLDARIKVRGAAKYGIDVTAAFLGEQQLLNAVVVRPSQVGATVEPENASEILGAPGVRHVVSILDGRGVAVVADTFWQALSASRRLKVRTIDGPNAGFDTDILMARYATVLNSEANAKELIGSKSDFQGAYPGAQIKHERAYFVPYAAHATMEPMNATVRLKDGFWEVYSGTQFQGAAQAAAAKVAGVTKSQVKIHTMLAGGGFGRRLVVDYVSEAVAISKAIGGAAVKLTWTREDDYGHDYYRPYAAHKLKAGISGDKVLALYHHIATESINDYCVQDYVGALLPDVKKGTLINDLVSEISRDVLEGLDLDPFSFEGADKLSYNVNKRVLMISQLKKREQQIPIGYWRSVGHVHTTFALESFIDELCVLTKMKPEVFRRQACNNPRLGYCLELVLKRSSFEDRSTWPSAPIGRGGRALGLAMHSGWGSHCAMVADVEVDNDFNVRVHYVYAAVDCGFVLQPDMVKAQIESGIVFGLTSALKQEIKFKNGVAQASNFHDADLLRMNECPQIWVEYVKHYPSVPPTGVGELGVPPVAPAVRNAILTATKRAVNRLPFTSEVINDAVELK